MSRLDDDRKGGDSLVNRYRYFRLHPFSLRELDPRPAPRFFRVHRGDRHYASGKVTVLSCTTFCRELNLP
jgi:hypothetical protein